MNPLDFFLLPPYNILHINNSHDMNSVDEDTRHMEWFFRE